MSYKKIEPHHEVASVLHEFPKFWYSLLSQKIRGLEMVSRIGLVKGKTGHLTFEPNMKIK
jgi:hypothetical protein